MAQFGDGNTVTNKFVPGQNATDPAKTGFVFAGRKLNSNNQLILPTNGQTMPSPYIPFRLTSYKDGASALTQLKQMGFQYQTGYNISQELTAPNLVDADPVTGLVNLVYNSTTTGLESITGTITTGSVTQVSSGASATIRSLEITQTQTILTVALVTSSPDFDTTGAVVITVTVATQAPNPKLSDEVCVFVYWYFQKYAASAKFTTAPDLWVSTLITGSDTDVNASSSPVALIAPTTVVVLADTSVNLTYAVTANNLGLLPTSNYGQSTVIQDTSDATGIFNGFRINNNLVTINVINVVGTFNTTNTISIQRDTSINGALLTGSVEIGGYAMCYPVANATQLNNYPVFKSVITLKTQPSEVVNNQFNIKGYYGFVPSFVNQYPITYYIQPDNADYVCSINLAVTTAYQYPCTNVMVVAQSLFTDQNNEAPFQSDSGVGAITNLPVSLNQYTFPSVPVLEQLVSQGVTPIAIDNNVSYWYQRVCTLQTTNGNQDLEYRYMALQLKKRWLDRNIELTNRGAVTDPNTGQRVNNDPGLLKNIKTRGEVVIQTGVDLGMLGTINNSVTTTLNPNDVTRILETVNTSIVSQNNGIDTVVYVNSYLG